MSSTPAMPQEAQHDVSASFPSLIFMSAALLKDELIVRWFYFRPASINIDPVRLLEADGVLNPSGRFQKFLCGPGEAGKRQFPPLNHHRTQELSHFEYRADLHSAPSACLRHSFQNVKRLSRCLKVHQQQGESVSSR